MKNRDGGKVNDHWATPKWLYEKLDAEFRFDFDPCPLNAEFDGLSMEWGSCNFVNPPYNRHDKPRFVRKAYEEWLKGKTSVLLIPAAVSTKDFHDLILPHAEVRFLKGRVAFQGVNTKGERVTTAKGKHDSMVVIFRARHEVSNDLGNRRAAFGASGLTDGLCGNGTEVGAGDTAKGTT